MPWPQLFSSLHPRLNLSGHPMLIVGAVEALIIRLSLYRAMDIKCQASNDLV
jgi:hypothetical protein